MVKLMVMALTTKNKDRPQKKQRLKIMPTPRDVLSLQVNIYMCVCVALIHSLQTCNVGGKMLGNNTMKF